MTRGGSGPLHHRDSSVSQGDSPTYLRSDPAATNTQIAAGQPIGVLASPIENTGHGPTAGSKGFTIKFCLPTLVVDAKNHKLARKAQPPFLDDRAQLGEHRGLG
ncbi:hypothetical protein ACLOJK_018270 [Asimina triloba]